MYKPKPSIRIRQKDVEEIDWHVRSFNSKLSWYKRKHGDLDYLPDYMSRDKFLENVETRADYKFKLNQMKIMGDNLDGVKTTGGKIVSEGELKAVKRAEWRENIKKGHMRRKLDKLIEEGKNVDMDEYQKYAPKNIDYDKLSPAQFDKYFDTQMRMGMDSYARYRTSVYQENIITALEKNFMLSEYEDKDGNVTRILPESLKELIRYIESLDPMELYEMVLTDARKSIPQYYLSKYDSNEDAIEYFKEIWGYKEEEK